MNQTQNRRSIALALVVAAAQAEIVSNDFWKTHNWTSGRLAVEDGIAAGTDSDTTQFITSAWTRIGHPDNYLELANVQRVNRVFPEATWDAWTANADATITYDSFLKAAAKFPLFCDEVWEVPQLGGVPDYDSACKREIATLFAHIEHNSEGMSQLSDPACLYSLDEEACGYKSGTMDTPSSSLFFARGPFGLIGDKEYAAFSKEFYEGYDRSDELLNYPERVAEDAYVGLSSAIWKYMQPRNNGPSMHSIMTGFFKPNGSDTQAGHVAGFGTTILANDPTECGGWVKSAQALARKGTFQSNQEALGLVPDTAKVDCDRMWPDFTWSGSANIRLYFARNWGGGATCKAVDHATPYSATERDSYKRCVCDTVLNDIDNINCQQAEAEIDPTPGPTPEPVPQPDGPLEELYKMIQEIKRNPDYSEDEPSNTTWQVDEILDYIEERLFNIERAFVEEGLMPTQ